MAYDEDLADRIRAAVAVAGPVDEKQMFGGLAFLLAGHMAVVASGQGGLMVRVGREDLPTLLGADHVEAMVMGGRTSRTWLRVAPDGVRTADQLEVWVRRGVATARALPPK